jgi:polyisoprenoid-binding protein YceI
MTVRYSFDPALSRFTVQAFATGVLSAFAHCPTFAIRSFAGELQFDPDSPATATLRITVQADTLELLDNVKPQDRAEIVGRMRQEVLETATYPEIAFEGREIKADKIADGWYRLQLAGQFSLHGARRPEQLDAQLRITGEEARLSGRFGLSQSAYRIKHVSALGGAIKVKDALAIDFELVGRTDPT